MTSTGKTSPCRRPLVGQPRRRGRKVPERLPSRPARLGMALPRAALPVPTGSSSVKQRITCTSARMVRSWRSSPSPTVRGPSPFTMSGQETASRPSRSRRGSGLPRGKSALLLTRTDKESIVSEAWTGKPLVTLATPHAVPLSGRQVRTRQQSTLGRPPDLGDCYRQGGPASPLPVPPNLPRACGFAANYLIVRLAIPRGNVLQLIEPATGKLVRTFSWTPPMGRIRFDPTGARFVTYGGRATSDSATGRRET